MNSLVAAVIRALAPVVVAEARKYLETDEGRAHVAELRGVFVKAVLSAGDPIEEARRDGSPG